MQSLGRDCVFVASRRGKRGGDQDRTAMLEDRVALMESLVQSSAHGHMYIRPLSSTHSTTTNNESLNSVNTVDFDSLNRNSQVPLPGLSTHLHDLRHDNSNADNVDHQRQSSENYVTATSLLSANPPTKYSRDFGDRASLPPQPSTSASNFEISHSLSPGFARSVSQREQRDSVGRSDTLPAQSDKEEITISPQKVTYKNPFRSSVVRCSERQANKMTPVQLGTLGYDQVEVATDVSSD